METDVEHTDGMGACRPVNTRARESLTLQNSPRLSLALKLFGYALLIGYCALAITDVHDQPVARQWDFKAYYYGPLAWAQGRNPYAEGVIRAVSKSDTEMVFLYPPATLYALRPLSLMPYDLARQVFLGGKVVALVLLLYLCKRILPKEIPEWLFWLVCLLGFNGAMYWDLAAGNISIFEQLLLWAGFLAYLHDRPSVFATLVVLASVCKITLILFLGLLLVRGRRTSVRTFVVAAVAYPILLFAPFAMEPHLIHGFFRQIFPQFTILGPWNTGILALIQEIAELKLAPEFLHARFAQVLLYGLYVAALLTYSRPALHRVLTGTNRIQLIVSATIVYALIMPRFMAYSYILLILPSVFVFTEVLKRADPRYTYLGLMALSIPSVSKLPWYSWAVLDIFWKYYPLLLTLGMWVAYVHLLRDRTVPATAPSPSATL